MAWGQTVGGVAVLAVGGRLKEQRRELEEVEDAVGVLVGGAEQLLRPLCCAGRDRPHVVDVHCPVVVQVQIAEQLVQLLDRVAQQVLDRRVLLRSLRQRGEARPAGLHRLDHARDGVRAVQVLGDGVLRQAEHARREARDRRRVCRRHILLRALVELLLGDLLGLLELLHHEQALARRRADPAAPEADAQRALGEPQRAERLDDGVRLEHAGLGRVERGLGADLGAPHAAVARHRRGAGRSGRALLRGA